MRRAKRFFALAPRERRLLFVALSRLCRTCLKLHLLPPKKWNALLNASSPATVRPITQEGFSEEQVIWAVRAAARYVPTANCLPQAIVARQLLVEQGYEPVLRIGVQAPEKLGLQAHAWVEAGGRVLIGDDGREYHALGATR
jgi:hypothetical protein